jgi:hypothetical protein
MLNLHFLDPMGLGLLLIRRCNRMENGIQNLICEYCALENMDRVLRASKGQEQKNVTGLRRHQIRRQEILLQLTAWLVTAKDTVQGQSLGG